MERMNVYDTINEKGGVTEKDRQIANKLEHLMYDDKSEYETHHGAETISQLQEENMYFVSRSSGPSIGFNKVGDSVTRTVYDGINGGTVDSIPFETLKYLKPNLTDYDKDEGTADDSDDESD